LGPKKARPFFGVKNPRPSWMRGGEDEEGGG